nr:centrosomal protein of 131 kDa isoform X2 [Parasteatoda tepidariorum]
MAEQNVKQLLRTEAEYTFIDLMDEELEMMGEELLHVKQIINARGNQRMMTKQMAPLKELDSAQESIIEEFYQRLERECEYNALLLNQDNLASKVDRFEDMLEGFKYVYQRVRDNRAKKIKEQREKLEHLCSKQQAEVEDFRRRLQESENELRNAVSKLRKEEDATKELLFKNSNLSFDILKLKKQLTAVKYDYQKIVGEKEELNQRLTEAAWNSAGEHEMKAAVEQAFEIEKPVIWETIYETKLNASRRQMSKREERDYHSHQQLRNKEKELDEILSRLEGEKKTSIYEQLLKNLESLDDDDDQYQLPVSRPMNLKVGARMWEEKPSVRKCLLRDEI